MYKIRIELQSHLCASSGEGYASTIDTDIVVDQMGIPYIPARRLKGCLRDAAVYIYGEHCDVVNRIFGISGDSASGALKVENAKIEEYAAFSSMCQKQGLTASRVTELFTDTIASTAVESSGAAKENTLRFMRYVSRTKAWNSEQNLVFCADVEIDEAYVEHLRRICKALRHIGYKRNRGFGSVRCTLIEKTSNTEDVTIQVNMEDETDYTISYAIHLDENLMLPAQSADESADYISGQAVVGALAGKYLKTHTADDTFDELFLRGNVRFSNLYITNTAFQSFVPVPQIFGKVKQSNRIIDLTVTERGTEIVKPLKNGYINANLELKKPLTERIYHNHLHNPDGGLYVQNCLQDGQLFMGTITGKGIYLKTIMKLLTDGTLSFGRSKTAQYSRCSLVALTVSAATQKKIRLHRGEKAVYLFESDVLLQDGLGGTATDISSVCDALNIDEMNLEPESGLKHRKISGYLSVMRMQRTHLSAIAAGSALVITCKEDTELDEIIYIGGRQNEGYGKVRVYKVGELLKQEVPILTYSDVTVTESHDDIQAMFVLLEKDEKMRNDAISYAQSKKAVFLREWGAAFIGRITLMLKQSHSESNFRERVASVKSAGKRQTAEQFVKDAYNQWERDPQYKTWEKKQEYLLIILTFAKYFHKEYKEGGAK